MGGVFVFITTTPQEKNTIVAQYDRYILTLEEFVQIYNLYPPYKNEWGEQNSTYYNDLKNKIVKTFLVDSAIKVWFENNHPLIRSSKIIEKQQELTTHYPTALDFKQSLFQNKRWNLKKWARMALYREALYNHLKKNISIDKKEIVQTLKKKEKEFSLGYYFTVKVIYFSHEHDAEYVKNSLENKKTSFNKVFSLLKNKMRPPIIRLSENAPLLRHVKKQVNEISPVIKINGEFLIYKIIARKKYSKKNIYSVVRKSLFEEKLDKKYNTWLKNKLKSRKVKINMALLNYNKKTPPSQKETPEHKK